MHTTLTTGTEEAQRLVDAVPHWHHAYEIVPGVRSRGAYAPAPMMEQMGLPARLDGMTAIDIGCSDGFFTFELERRGADVLAVDASPPTPGFALAHRLRGSSVEHVRDNIYDMTPARYGRFDIVLFCGVLYHLRHPLLGIDIASQLCRGTLAVETHGLDDGFVLPDGGMGTLDDTRLQLMQFYPGRELSGDESNWWAPSLSCLSSMVETALMRVRHACIWHPGRILVVADAAPETELTHYPSGSWLTDSCCYFPPGIAPRPELT